MKRLHREWSPGIRACRKAVLALRDASGQALQCSAIRFLHLIPSHTPLVTFLRHWAAPGRRSQRVWGWFAMQSHKPMAASFRAGSRIDAVLSHGPDQGGPGRIHTHFTLRAVSSSAKELTGEICGTPRQYFPA